MCGAGYLPALALAAFRRLQQGSSCLSCILKEQLLGGTPLILLIRGTITSLTLQCGIFTMNASSSLITLLPLLSSLMSSPIVLQAPRVRSPWLTVKCRS